MTDVPSVLLVEDHPVLLVGLKISLERLGFCNVLGEAVDGEAAVREAQRLRPDIVLMDVGLPGIDGVEATWQIKQLLPKTHVIMFTSHTSNDDVSEALGAGAEGYCSKDASLDQVGKAITAVLTGEIWLDPTIAEAIVTKYRTDGSGSAYPLTEMELQILSLIKNGTGNSEISSRLNVSAEQINREMHNIIHRFTKERPVEKVASADKKKGCSPEWFTALDEDSHAGRTFADKYLIEGLIGNGGVGAVFKAKHLFMDRLVALKLLHAEFAEDRLAMRNFQREARAVAKLQHENIVGLHDFGMSETGEPYLVMEYINGTNLFEILKEEHHLPVARVIKICRQICAGLSEAHSKGVIHCDLKPSNILLLGSADNEIVKLVDFGLAQVLAHEPLKNDARTAKFYICGTPSYMSPEQCLDDRLDALTDIYSLGCILYEALAGKNIFEGRSPMETFARQCESIAPPMSTIALTQFPPALEECVSSMLEKDPKKRPQSAQAVMELLDLVQVEVEVEVDALKA